MPPVCRTDIRSLHSHLLHQHLAKEGSKKQEAGRTNTGCCCQPGDHDDLLSDAFPGETELCFILPQGMRVSGLDGGWRGELGYVEKHANSLETPIGFWHLYGKRKHNSSFIIGLL